MIHPSHLREARSALTAIALLTALMTVGLVLPAPQVTRGLAGYAPLHTVLELLAIAVALMVFSIAWHNRKNRPCAHILWLGTLFLGVAVLDLSHALSYAGMPDWITPSGPEKAINFWLAARTLAALALLGAALLPQDRPLRVPDSVLLLGVAVLLAMVHYLFLFKSEFVPRTFIQGQGLTIYKIVCEYLLVGTYVLAALLWARQWQRPRVVSASKLVVAATTMAISEFFFTLYANVTDVYNLLGHIYKVVAYLFLYLALFAENIRQPYEQLRQSQRQLQATLETLPDLLFEIDEQGNYVSIYTPAAREKLVAPASNLVGANLRDVMPEAAARLCMAAIDHAKIHHTCSGTRIELEVPAGLRHFELSVARKDALVSGYATFLVLSRDVTEIVLQQQTLERQAQLNANLAELREDAGTGTEDHLLDKSLHMLARLMQSPVVMLQPVDVVANTGGSVWAVSAEIVAAIQADVGIWSVQPGNLPRVWNSTAEVSPELVVQGVERLLTLVVTENAEVRMLVAVANKVTAYTTTDIETLQTFAVVLWGYLNRLRQRTAVAQKQAELDAFFSTSLDLFAIATLDGSFLRVNNSWHDLMGYEEKELIGRNFMDFVHPDDRAASGLALSHLGGQDQSIVGLENRWLASDGSVRYIEWRVKASNGLAYASVRDVTERRMQEADLRRLSAAVAQSPFPVVITDAQACIQYVNEAFTVVSQYSAEEVLGRNPRFLQSGETPHDVYIDMWNHLVNGNPWRGELLNRRKNGETYTEQILIYPVRDNSGHIVNYLSHKEDITMRKKAEERIQQLSNFDLLTGLPNRQLLEQRIGNEMSRAHKNGTTITVLWLNLDNFKIINDSLGHAAGDFILCEAAKRMNSQLREQDTLARQTGDTFVVLLPGQDQDGAAAFAARVLQTLQAPFQMDGHELNISASIGLAVYPHDGDALDALMMSAESAMYRVKQEGRNAFRFYSPEMQEHTARTLGLSNGLKHALARNELRLVYQPQSSLRDGRIVGAEALLRWESPQWGMVSPAEFIPLAERNGLIVAMGDWVLRTAAMQLKAWQELGLTDLTIGVNLSAIQFAQPDLAQKAAAIVAEVGVSPGSIELELTEAVALKDPAGASATMHALRDAGFKLSIDDFGTGYSSMSYLKRFAVDRLKIDQSFVRGIASSSEDQVIIIAIIQMAQGLGMTAIAEGVETIEQREFLRQRGCDDMQGYWFSKPLPPQEFLAFFEKCRLAQA